MLSEFEFLDSSCSNSPGSAGDGKNPVSRVPEGILSLLILSGVVEPGVGRELKSWGLRFCLNMFAM